jgi:hypothetical protein
MEGWDPIFSRWPKWSESFIYTFTRESRPSYWSNMSSLYASLAFDFGTRHGLVMPRGPSTPRVIPRRPAATAAPSSGPPELQVSKY